MPVRIGKMRKRVGIYLRADTEAEEFSSQITRTLVDTVWANVSNVSGTQQVDSRNAAAGITHRFYMRDRSDVSKVNELQYNGRWYEIITVQRDQDERSRFLVLECNEMDTVDTLDELSPE